MTKVEMINSMKNAARLNVQRAVYAWAAANFSKMNQTEKMAAKEAVMGAMAHMLAATGVMNKSEAGAWLDEVEKNAYKYAMNKFTAAEWNAADWACD